MPGPRQDPPAGPCAVAVRGPTRPALALPGRPRSDLPQHERDEQDQQEGGEEGGAAKRPWGGTVFCLLAGCLDTAQSWRSSSSGENVPGHEGLRRLSGAPISRRLPEPTNGYSPATLILDRSTAAQEHAQSS